MTIYQKLADRVAKVNSLLCIGLDSDLSKIPQQFQHSDSPQFAFNQHIIDQTHRFACAYKLNTAFYEAEGAVGWQAMADTLNYLHHNHPDIVTICDAKRADIGSTNQGYVKAFFDDLDCDAITLHPYLGQEAIQPFLDRADKASIILCHTSNPGAGELQELNLKADDKPVWFRVAKLVATKWNTNRNCMLVVGATYPEELAQVRQLVGDMPILVPGIGAQGGDLQAVLKAGLTADNDGLIINSSRDIIFADNPAAKAQVLVREMHENINRTTN